MKTNLDIIEMQSLCETSIENLIIGKPYEDMDIVKYCEFIAYSVLKKLIQVSADKKCREMRADIVRMQSSIEAKTKNDESIIGNLYRFNEEGDRVLTNEGLQYIAIDTDIIHNDTMGDGCDLVHDAFIAIYDEALAQYESKGYVNFDEQYTTTKQSKRVVIRDEDSKGLYKEVETSPIVEAFHHVRECIAKSGNFTTASHRFTYLESELDNGDTVYKRINGIDVGQMSYNETFSHGSTVSAVDDDAMHRINSIISELGLSSQQKAIVGYRLRGYGKKAIATALGIREDNVKIQLKRIKAKAEAKKYTFENITDTDSNYTNGRANKGLLSDAEKKLHQKRNDRAKAITEKYEAMNR